MISSDVRSLSFRLSRNVFPLLALAAGALLAAGCVVTRQSEPKRTAVEQLLLSNAADDALSEIDLSSLNGKAVHLEEKYFDSEDKMYVLGAIRELISAAGGKLAAKPEDAEVIVEARSGALSIDSGSSLVGIPEMPVPIPLSGTVVSPEVPFYKADRQFGVARIALLAYDAKNRQHLLSTGAKPGYSHHHYFRILGFIKWTSTSLPEKKR